MSMRRSLIFSFLVVIAFLGCITDKGNIGVDGQELTIFFINDPHAQLENFAKIKHIVDQERASKNVLLTSSGDLFSGDPVVDNYEQKGYPMIDLMNKVGFDVSAVGNHEFDYGELVLHDRMLQADFSWVCANVNMGNTGVPQPSAFKTLEVGDLTVTFLGLVETEGKENGTIPSTHPWRVQNFIFNRPEEVVSNCQEIKDQENADILIALTHLGHNGNDGVLGDYQLANKFPYFDLILGGHSHYRIDTVVNSTPVFQTGSYLNYLGKVNLVIKNREIVSYDFELINLNNYNEVDPEIQQLVEQYSVVPQLEEVVGESKIYHSKSQLGCFYTDALRIGLNVNVSFQNTGGIRSGLDEGDITRREILEIDPFNNGTVKYEMSVREIKDFLKGSGAGFYYSGIQISQEGNAIYIRDMQDNIMADEVILSVGMNDYIPAVHDQFFPANGEILSITTAEVLMKYLEEINSVVNYPDCNNYFRFQQ